MFYIDEGQRAEARIIAKAILNDDLVYFPSG